MSTAHAQGSQQSQDLCKSSSAAEIELDPAALDVLSLPTRIWDVIASKLELRERLRGLDMVCKEFHSQLTFQCINLDVELDMRMEKARIVPDIPWVLGRWYEVAAISVTFGPSFLREKDVLQTFSALLQPFSSIRCRQQGSVNVQSFSAYCSSDYVDVHPTGAVASFMGSLIMGFCGRLMIDSDFHRPLQTSGMPRIGHSKGLQVLHLRMSPFPSGLPAALSRLYQLQTLRLETPQAHTRYAFRFASQAINLQLEHLQNLQDVHLSFVTPGVICLPAQCRLHLRVHLSNLTGALLQRLGEVNSADLEIHEHLGSRSLKPPTGDMLCPLLERLDCVKALSLYMDYQRVEADASRSTVLDMPLLRQCSRLHLFVSRRTCLCIPAAVRLEEFSLHLHTCRWAPVHLVLGDLHVFAGSLRRVRICLGDSLEPGTLPEFSGILPLGCQQLLAAAKGALQTVDGGCFPSV